MRSRALLRPLLLLSWLVAGVGYYGPWIAHSTAALSVSGVDMGEFVKFVPDALSASPNLARQLFYLPPFAVVVSIALLIGSRQLRFHWLWRIAAIVLSVPISLQILPPAWSPGSLMTDEFRLQSIALGICLLLLATSWLLGRLHLRLAGSLVCALALAAGAGSLWSLWKIKPSIDQVYQTAPSVGWGLVLCQLGLAMLTGSSLALTLQPSRRGESSWRKE